MGCNVDMRKGTGSVGGAIECVDLGSDCFTVRWRDSLYGGFDITVCWNMVRQGTKSIYVGIVGEWLCFLAAKQYYKITRPSDS